MDLLKELEAATKAHDEAKRAESEAQNIMADARQRLNKAQQAVDKAMATMKAKAPWNTDWYEQREQPRAAT